MSLNISARLFGYMHWFFFRLPKKLLKFGINLVRTVNNSISFTLNIRLFLTPIYRDYSFAGILTSLFIRIGQLLFGTTILFSTLVFAIALPALWYAIPIYLVQESVGVLFLYLCVTAGIYLLTVLGRPTKHVVDVNSWEDRRCFKQIALDCIGSSYDGDMLAAFLSKNSVWNTFLQRLEVETTDFGQKVIENPVSPKELQSKAFSLAKDRGTFYVELEHVLDAMICLRPSLDIFLSTYKLKESDIHAVTNWLVSTRDQQLKESFFKDEFEMPAMSGSGKGMTGKGTPNLTKASQDFTALAAKGKFEEVLAHKDVIDEVIEILATKKSNVLLVGPPGSGKTSIVKGIAQKIADGTSSNGIRFKRLLEVDISSFMRGSGDDVGKRINLLMDEAVEARDVIIFFDEIHALVAGTIGGDNPDIVFSLLQPYIENSRLQFIGATSTQEYRRFIESNGSFSRLFETVEIPPASDEDTTMILWAKARQFETEHSVFITFPAIRETITLAKKLIHERVFPDKSLIVFDKALSYALKKQKIINADLIAEVISEITHIPVQSITEDDSNKLLMLGDVMKKSVIGQDHAVDHLVKALQRSRVGIRDENKPIASFLFIGTTGVGKTETAKTLAKCYFQDDKSILRLDMSEYQQTSSISKLIGSLENKSKGLLTEHVRARPFSLILLDELEKADANVMLLFLQVLDDGRLTDAYGNLVSFSNCIIIATSNAGTGAVQRAWENGKPDDEISQLALNEVRDRFAPEFLNRFSSIVVFKPLTSDHIKAIVNIKLDKVREIARQKNINVTFTEELVTRLAEVGFDPKWGAREINRLVEEKVESFLAYKILAKELSPGSQLSIGVEVFK